MDTQAKDIMSSELLVGYEDMTIEEALKILMNNRITGMPVVDKKGRMVGVVSEFDVMNQIAASKKVDRKLFQSKIKYTKADSGIPETMPLKDVLDHFLKTKYRRLPVFDSKGKLVGIITRRDLMRVFFYRAHLS